MKHLTQKQRLAMVWHATPAAHRGYLAGQKSVLAFRRSVLHMLPLSVLSNHEIHLRIHLALRVKARELLADRGLPSLLSVDGKPWGVAFRRGASPFVVYLQDVVRGNATFNATTPLDGADFARRFVAAQAFAAQLNALEPRKTPLTDKEMLHD